MRRVLPCFTNSADLNPLLSVNLGTMPRYGRGRERVRRVAEFSHPLDVIKKSRSLLVLADVQNLDYSARDLRRVFSYRRLGELLERHARSCSLHAFFSVDEHSHGRADYFAERGWIPHPYEVHEVETFRGRIRRTNIDNYLLFFAGTLVQGSSADTVAVCSGDGHMVSDLSMAIAQLPGRRTIVTLSLPGSTAFELMADHHRFIDANIELGDDVMYPRRDGVARRQMEG